MTLWFYQYCMFPVRGRESVITSTWLKCKLIIGESLGTREFSSTVISTWTYSRMEGVSDVHDIMIADVDQRRDRGAHWSATLCVTQIYPHARSSRRKKSRRWKRFHSLDPSSWWVICGSRICISSILRSANPCECTDDAAVEPVHQGGALSERHQFRVHGKSMW